LQNTQTGDTEQDLDSQPCAHGHLVGTCSLKEPGLEEVG
jgi:hypothetical protein